MSFFIVAFYLFNFLNLFARKYVRWVPLLSLLLMWVLIWGNYQNPDTMNYTNMYINLKSNDVGFNFLMYISNKFNLEYPIFVAIMTAVSYILIYKMITKYVKNISYVLLMYSIFPFVIDYIQLRNFICMSFFLYGFSCLVDSKKSSSLKYIIYILLGASIQLIALAYLPFVFFQKGFDSRFKKILFVCFIFLSVLFSISRPILNKIGMFLASVFHDSRLLSFFNVQTNYGFLILWLNQIVAFVFITFMYLELKNRILPNDNIPIKELKFIKTTFNLSLYGFFFLPFYVYDVTFNRLIRNLLIIYYVCLSLYNRNVRPRSSTKICVNLLFILFIIWLNFFEVSISGGVLKIYEPLFKYNIILK